MQLSTGSTISLSLDSLGAAQAKVRSETHFCFPESFWFPLGKGHSMSSDPAKMGFFIWPSSKLLKFCKGKDLRLLSWTKLKFSKPLKFSKKKLWAFEILMLFKRIKPKNYRSFSVATSTDSHSFISDYFHSIFCSKVQGFMLDKTESFLLVTFEPWLIFVI